MILSILKIMSGKDTFLSTAKLRIYLFIYFFIYFTCSIGHGNNLFIKSLFFKMAFTNL